MYKIVLVGLFSFSLLFTRLYNLPQTTRFTRDESSNLVDMHRIFKDKELTMIGPVDVNNIIIYPSLTHYMLLPFAVLGNFSPASPAYGSVFWGVAAALLLLVLVNKVSGNKFLIWIGILIVVWYPFVESARWAWNPHLVPFASVLALLFWFRKKIWAKFISGVFFGVCFWLHYFSFVSFAVFIFIWGLVQLGKGKLKEVGMVGLGFVLTLVPFVVFDLKNPPGLFFGKYLSSNLISQGTSRNLANLPELLLTSFNQTSFYVTQNWLLAIVVGLGICYLIYWDIKYQKNNLVFILPVITQLAMVAFLPYFAGRYFLLASIFFIVWLVQTRDLLAERVTKGLIILMIVGSAFSLPKLLTKPQIAPGGGVVGELVNYMVGVIKSRELKNVNVAVLASTDPDPLGVIYRDTLLVNEVRILPATNYTLTDNLFVITQENEASVRTDNANVVDNFRKGKASLEYQLPNTSWKLFLFNRNQ